MPIVFIGTAAERDVHRTTTSSVLHVGGPKGECRQLAAAGKGPASVHEVKGIDLALAEDLREKTVASSITSAAAAAVASTLSTATTTTAADGRHFPPLLKRPSMATAALATKAQETRDETTAAVGEPRRGQAAAQPPTLYTEVTTSPRVAEELSPEEIKQAVQQVLSFSFPLPALDDPLDGETSVFSGFIFVNGKQLAWTRSHHRCPPRQHQPQCHVDAATIQHDHHHHHHHRHHHQDPHSWPRDRISLSTREERDLPQTDWLDAKLMLFSLP